MKFSQMFICDSGTCVAQDGWELRAKKACAVLVALKKATNVLLVIASARLDSVESAVKFQIARLQLNSLSTNHFITVCPLWIVLLLCSLLNTDFSDAPANPEAPSATCSVYGPSMIKTFDGRTYKSPMNCRYILAMDAADNWQDTETSWSITIQNVKCDNPKTCQKVGRSIDHVSDTE